MNWTEGRKKSFLTSVIRSGFRRWPIKYEALKEAFTQKGINPASGRIAALYKCAKCKGEFSAKNIQVDHINPAVDPTKGFIDWNTFIDRLFCPIDNLQVLCIGCHQTKTKKEKAIANDIKAKKRQSDV